MRRPDRHPCLVCGVWECDQCGWQRRPANLLRPDLQHCSRCESKTGKFIDVYHTAAYIQAEHDVDADRELGKQEAFGYVYAPDSPQRDAWLATHQRSTEMTDTILDLTDDMALHTAVNLALGAVSVCWENPAGAGTFLSDRAVLISEELVDFIREKIAEVAPEPEEESEFAVGGVIPGTGGPTDDRVRFS